MKLDEVKGNLIYLSALLEENKISNNRAKVESILNKISCFPSYFPETWWISLYSRLFRLGWIISYKTKKAAALSLLESQGDFHFKQIMNKASALAFIGKRKKVMKYF